jgi:hypothetical protein
VVSAAEPPRPLISVFWTADATFSFKYLLIYSVEAEWSSLHTRYYSEKLISQGNEPGTSGTVARNSDH